MGSMNDQTALPGNQDIEQLRKAAEQVYAVA